MDRRSLSPWKALAQGVVILGKLLLDIVRLATLVIVGGTLLWLIWGLRLLAMAHSRMQLRLLQVFYRRRPGLGGRQETYGRQ